MKLIDTTDAVGHVLCHDITRIIPGREKGPVFRKGHIVTEEDIPVLLSVGKEHLYVWEKNDDMLHEDEAAYILRDICTGGSDDMTSSEPSEGKIEIRAAVDGLLRIDTEKLMKINLEGDMMIASVKGNVPVRKGDPICGTRVIPLVISKEKMERAKKIAGDEAVFRILPFRDFSYGIITTGSEVAKGLIKDSFGPVLKAKADEFGGRFMRQAILSDDMEKVTEEILKMAEEGAGLIMVSGGMSVDPDDRTPGAIKATGADIVTYGAPVLPGAMFLLSYLDHGGKKIPVLGIPGCAMYKKRTVLDLVLPRIIAGEILTAEDIASYGEGGLCMSCDVCTFPHCRFGT